MKTAVALGLFDGVHRGHRSVLGATIAYAAERKLKTDVFKTAVFTFDTATVSTKGRDFAPVYPDSIKRLLIGRTGIEEYFSVDFSLVKDLSPGEFTDMFLVEKLDAAAVFCGTDFTFGKNASGNAGTLKKLCEQRGIEVYVIDDVMYSGRKISSTQIRGFIRDGNIRSANTLLTENYRICGEVVHGRHLGSRLGYPTANIMLDRSCLLPRFGVYAAKCDTDTGTLFGAANIGIKPTVGSDAPLCEVNFFDFEGDLYGKVLEVQLTDFVRPEMRFSGVDELFARIAYDTGFIRDLMNGG